MKQLVSFLFILLFFQFSWSQKSTKQQFVYHNTKIEKVIADVERKFNIKFSYVDSITANKKITLSKGFYSLEEINSKIEEQSFLKIVKIDDRFYSIIKENSEPIKTYNLDEILIEGFLAKGINKTNQRVEIYPQKVEALPGVTDADILLSLQQLPGVKSPNETASGLNVRGGTLDQNLVMWDGIRLYHPGHLFGMISGFNPNVEQTVYYYNKATNPKFGERISSVIDIKTTGKISDKLKINAGINALDADVYLQTPLYKKKLGFQLSARKSFTEWAQTPTFSQLADKVFQNTNFSDFNNQNKFQFQDYSAKLNFKPNSKTVISLTGIVIDNNLNFRTETDNAVINNQKMNISDFGFSLNWSQKYSDKFNQKTLIYYSAYNFDYEKKQEYSASDFESFKKINRIIDSGAEFNFAYAPMKNLQLEYGYQIFGNDISHLFNTYNQDISIDLSLKHLYNITHVGYAFAKYDYNDWNFQAGMRYNRFSKLKAASFEPRFLAQKHFSESVIGQISYERKSQISSQVRENAVNDLSLENYVWVLSENGTYPVQKANQITAGLIFKDKFWLLDVDLYYKTIAGITSLTFGFLNQNDANIHVGNGFTKGMDVLLQRSSKTWRTWVTYTYQDSYNRFESVNNGDYFQINSNIKHAFNWSFNKKWSNYSLALGWFWHSGKPYSLLNESEQITSFNSQKLPNYHRLDVSGSYQFPNPKKVKFKIGISVYNLYNHHNIISKEFERKYNSIDDFTNPKYKIQDFYSLGITPNVFLRMSF